MLRPSVSVSPHFDCTTGGISARDRPAPHCDPAMRPLESKIGPPSRKEAENHPSSVERHTPETHRRTEFCLPIRKSSFLSAASGSLDGRTRSTEPAPGSFSDLASFQTYSRSLCSFADRPFAFPSKPLAFPFHNMNRAASAKSLLRPIGLCCDSSQGRPDRLC